MLPKVEICTSEDVSLPFSEEDCLNFLNKALIRLDFNNWQLSVMFCNNEFIRDLNHKFRNKDEATDVLSFENGETFDDDGEERFLAGDIVISLEFLQKNAEEFKVGINEELKRLLIHGILHLSGMDHATNGEDEEMLIRQERLLAEFEEVLIWK